MTKIGDFLSKIGRTDVIPTLQVQQGVRLMTFVHDLKEDAKKLLEKTSGLSFLANEDELLAFLDDKLYQVDKHRILFEIEGDQEILQKYLNPYFEQNDQESPDFGKYLYLYGLLTQAQNEGLSEQMDTFIDALGYLEGAFDVCDDYSIGKTIHLWIYYTCMQIGNIYMKYNEYESAEEYYEQASNSLFQTGYRGKSKFFEIAYQKLCCSRYDGKIEESLDKAYTLYYEMVELLESVGVVEGVNDIIEVDNKKQKDLNEPSYKSGLFERDQLFSLLLSTRFAKIFITFQNNPTVSCLRDAKKELDLIQLYLYDSDLLKRNDDNSYERTLVKMYYLGLGRYYHHGGFDKKSSYALDLIPKNPNCFFRKSADQLLDDKIPTLNPYDKYNSSLNIARTISIKKMSN